MAAVSGGVTTALLPKHHTINNILSTFSKTPSHFLFWKPTSFQPSPSSRSPYLFPTYTKSPTPHTLKLRPPIFSEMAAAAKFLGTYELVESLLLKTISFDILVATQVCKLWRNIVENSIPLRDRMLALQPPSRLPNTNGSMDPRAGYLWQPHVAGGRDSAWHFRTTASSGVLWVLRLPNENVEVFLLSPKKAGEHLKILHAAHHNKLVTRSSFSIPYPWDGSMTCNAGAPVGTSLEASRSHADCQTGRDLQLPAPGHGMALQDLC